MLCFMPQTWTSDNTDVLCRLSIQEGTSCGYPLSSMGAHVSASPNHQTLRRSDIESRFNVAAFGVLGYEMDITKLDDQQKEAIKNQIAFYKLHRAILQYGEFFRIVPASGDTNEAVWVAATPDRSEMLVLWAQKLNRPNPGCDILRIPVANPAYDYEVTPRRQKISIKMFGDLINRVSPVRLKNDGVLQQIVSETYSLDSEVEHHTVGGDVLAYGGIRLNQQFGGTGFDAQTRVLGDFGSRLYHIRRITSDR
jgi:alpha-galactosidase